jgi:hypothetical protein
MIDLTDAEVDLLIKMLDKAQTVGIETSRMVVRLADKLRESLQRKDA